MLVEWNSKFYEHDNSEKVKEREREAENPNCSSVQGVAIFEYGIAFAVAYALATEILELY